MVVFAPHNVLADPPFTKLDLLLCRNVLIYFDVAAQQWLLTLLHYALGAGGLVMLGPAESTTGFEHLFSPIDKKWRIFTRKDAGDGATAPLALYRGLGRGGLASPPIPSVHEQRTTRIAATAQRYLLQANVPATVLIGDNGDVAYIHGDTELDVPLRGAATQARVLVSARRLLQASGLPVRILLSVAEITERREPT